MNPDSWEHHLSFFVYFIMSTHTAMQRKHWEQLPTTTSLWHFQKTHPLDITYMPDFFFFLVLFPPLSFFWVLFISIYGKHIFASLLQTYTTHRIVDFIIAEKVQQCICPWGAIMTAHTKIWLPVGIHIRRPLSFRGLRNRRWELISKTVQWAVDKTYWILSL